MLRTRNPEVLVAGAGPVGLLAALTLANHGVRTAIVDREWRPGAHSYALALHARSLALLGELGLRDRVLETAYPVRTVALYDGAGQRRAEMRLPGDAAGGTGCVAVMRQDALEKLLADALKRAGVRVAWNHEVVRLVPEDDRVGATINELAKDAGGYAVAHSNWVVARSSDLNVPWVVGCDGHRSFVRRRLGIEFAESGPVQHFAVFEFKTNADLGDQMRLVFGERPGLAGRRRRARHRAGRGAEHERRIARGRRAGRHPGRRPPRRRIGRKTGRVQPKAARRMAVPARDRRPARAPRRGPPVGCPKRRAAAPLHPRRGRRPGGAGRTSGARAAIKPRPVVALLATAGQGIPATSHAGRTTTNHTGLATGDHGRGATTGRGFMHDPF